MNNYDLIEVVGEGTYGVVYKCRDKRTGRIVAVKQFKNFQTNAYIRCTMLRELRVEQLLKGEPNVTQLLETFKQKNRLYLVMEYIPRSLLDVLEEHHSGLDEDCLSVLLYTLLLGIQSCHRNGIIHRDIKPENILVRDDGTASLCDFGFCRPVLQSPSQQRSSSPSSSSPLSAKPGQRGGADNGGKIRDNVPGSSTMTVASTAASAFLSELVLAEHRAVMTDYVATRWYRSPEMLLGMSNYSYSVDMWAVGAIMAEAIDGQPLLPGKTELEQLALIQTRVGEFPAAYEAAVRKRNGGMLHLRSANPLTSASSSSSRSRVPPHRNVDGVDADATPTTSSYLRLRYGGRITATGMQLLARLLCVDAEGRLTVEEALAHPYFANQRDDPRFSPAKMPLSVKKLTSADEEEEEDEDEEETADGLAFTRQSASAATGIAASAGPLPPLSPTVRTPVAPLFITTTATTTTSAAGDGGDGRVFQRVERGSGNAGRPPRATETAVHAGGDSEGGAENSAADVSFPSLGSGSAWPSTTTSPRLATLAQLSGTPQPPLDGRDAASDDDDDDDGSDGGGLDGDSPPPRPVVVQPTVPERSPPLRRHAASEGTGDATTTAASGAVSSTTSKTPTDGFGKSGNHVATLLFKTKKGRAAAEAVPGRRPSLQNDEGEGGTPTATTGTSRFHHSTIAAGVLASLRHRHRSEETPLTSANDAEDARMQPDSRHPSPPLPLPTFFTKSFVAPSKGNGVAESENFFFSKPSAKHDEEAGMCMSAPRSGGERSPAIAAAADTTADTAHPRSSSYTVQNVQPSTNGASAKKAKKNARMALRPGLHHLHRPTASQETDSLASSGTGTSAPVPKRGAASEAAGPVALTERPSAKQRGTSPPRRRTTLQQQQPRSPAAAVTPLSARNPAGRKAGPRTITITTTTTRQRSNDKETARGTVNAKKAAAADSSPFASPTLPRVVKPLPPGERMTLLKEIESLGCPVETPSAVEVMVPTHSSPSVKEDDRGDKREADEDGEEERGGVRHGKQRNTPSASSSRASSAAGGGADVVELVKAGVSRRMAGGAELYVEDLDSDSVSHSPLLSEASGPGGTSPTSPPPTLTAFPASEVVASTAATAAQSRPPRMDFGNPTTNSNSNRAQPSLYFRSSRTTPAPLKLAAIYMTQSTTNANTNAISQSAVSGGGAGGSTSADGASSPSAHLAGVSGNAAAASHTASTSLSPSFGRRPTPTLLRHPPSKLSTSQPSPPSLPLELPNSGDGGGGKGALQPQGSSSHGPNSGSSRRTPRDDSPRVLTAAAVPSPHRLSTGYYVADRSPAQPPLSADDAAPTDIGATAVPPPLHSQHPQQRRLSANHLSLSVSGEFTHAGNLTLSRRSQERSTTMALTTTAALAAVPITSTDDVETEVLVESPIATPHARRTSPNPMTPSPACSGTTNTATPSRTTRDPSVATLQRSANRAASAADLTRSRTSAAGATPLPHGRKDGDDSEEDELPSGARTVSFPLPSSGDRSGSHGEATPSVREAPPPLALHPPQPVLGGVWVNVDQSKSGLGLFTGSSRKTSRLIG